MNESTYLELGKQISDRLRSSQLTYFVAVSAITAIIVFGRGDDVNLLLTISAIGIGLFGLLSFDAAQQAYIICPQRVAVGDTIIAGEKTDTKPGNAMLLGQMPVGTICHNVEMKPGKGGQIARSAGAYVQLVGRDRGMVIVRLNSGEQRYLRSDCMGTVGAVSNPDNQNQNFAKAGRTRWKGKRPLTRGVAKNPVDHPHGGGEGRTSGGRHPVTPWGKPTKGARTRNNKQTEKMIIRSRHAKKKR